MRRYVMAGAWVIIGFLLQSTIMQTISFANVSPNLLIIITASYGFMMGKKEGLIVGFFCGLIVDIFFGSVLGFYALLYMLIGYCNGLLHMLFYPDEIKLPMILITISDFVSGLTVYFFLFLFRGRFDFGYYFFNIIMPEVIYTILISIFLYLIILKINQKLETLDNKER
ncbi:MAG: rod shape-determining protein MreD [Lachnospiraceae bacterium]|nr:rod shape-determining protein MreD [Lachnospiraceae bacterium]